jgi:hypothetical protein
MFKGQTGLFAFPLGQGAFRDELQWNMRGNGSVQSPKDEPMPFDLIRQMEQF